MKLYRIKKSKIDNKGRGLYATKDIKAGTKIINYLGKIITNKKVEESNKFDNTKPIYLFNVLKSSEDNLISHESGLSFYAKWYKLD